MSLSLSRRINQQKKIDTEKIFKKKIKDIVAPAHSLPPIYPLGTKRQAETVFLKCETKGNSNENYLDRLSEGSVEGHEFVVDVGHSHVIDCTM